jgi:succinate dehydrogenase / fumarate reductase cytochrome b subunit
VKPTARPVYRNLIRIHLPLPGWVSILHRVSGALLFIALPPAVWVLSVSLADEAGFQRVAEWFLHPLARLLLLGLIWAFMHHLLAGLRHLALDVHWGTDLQRARKSSSAVMLASGLVTLLAAWRLFA